MTAEPASESGTGTGWGIANRAILILSSHVGFTIAAVIVVRSFYADNDERNSMLLAFLFREVFVLIFALFALFATEAGARAIASAFAKGLVRARPLVPLVEKLAKEKRLRKVVEVLRWVTLWLCITAGFVAAGTLILSTGGFQTSPFVQLPMTMVVLGAMMSGRWITAFLVFVYGSGYAILLAYRPWITDQLLGVYAPSIAGDDRLLVLLITGLNLFIGVSASYLASGQTERAQPLA